MLHTYVKPPIYPILNSNDQVSPCLDSAILFSINIYGGCGNLMQILNGPH